MSGAGRALGVHVSTVGRRLDSFEEELGVHLFDRTPDGVSPTVSVEKLMPWAIEVERRIADVDRVLEGMETEVSGIVKLSAPPGIVSQFLLPDLDALLRDHPKLRIELDASIGYADLTRGEADIALRASRPVSGDLIARRVGQSTACVLASQKLACEVGTIDELSDLQWITYQDNLAHIPDASWILKQVPESQVIMRTSFIHAQIDAAQMGLGAVVMAEAAGVRAGLCPVPLACDLAHRLSPLPSHELWLVGHRALREVPRIAAVWQHIEALFQRAEAV